MTAIATVRVEHRRSGVIRSPACEALLVGLFRKLDVGYLYGRSVVKRTLCDEPQISVRPQITAPIR
jgi:hypothetical protein